MKHSRNSTSTFVKGLFIGSAVGAAVVMRYIFRGTAQVRVDIPRVAIRIQSPERPIPISEVEHADETRTQEESSMWSRVMRALFVFGVMMAPEREKRAQRNRNDQRL